MATDGVDEIEGPVEHPDGTVTQQLGGKARAMFVATPLPDHGVHLNLANGAVVMDLPQAAVRYLVGVLMVAGGIDLASMVAGQVIIVDQAPALDADAAAGGAG